MPAISVTDGFGDPFPVAGLGAYFQSFATGDASARTAADLPAKPCMASVKALGAAVYFAVGGPAVSVARPPAANARAFHLDAGESVDLVLREGETRVAAIVETAGTSGRLIVNVRE